MRFTPQMRRLDWLVRRPFAHRGLHDEKVPENSSAAFQAALEKNYAIECDVQLTADGEAVVFHDDRLDRMTDERGLVLERKSKDICKLLLGNSRCKIQTLGEMLDQISGRTTLLIEIKSSWNGEQDLALRVLEVLKSYSGPFAVMSFDPSIISLLSERAPNIVRGIVADRVQDDYYSMLSIQNRVVMRQFLHLEETCPYFVSFDANGLPFEPVQQIRAAGFPVITWTITNEKMAERAGRYADQITFEKYQPR
jgi:glycerophosphoryl diester phosphodiesterase